MSVDLRKNRDLEAVKLVAKRPQIVAKARGNEYVQEGCETDRAMVGTCSISLQTSLGDKEHVLPYKRQTS